MQTDKAKIESLIKTSYSFDTYLKLLSGRKDTEQKVNRTTTTRRISNDLTRALIAQNRKG